MPNFRCMMCHQWTQRRDRLCHEHRLSLRGVKKAPPGTHVRIRRKTRPVTDQRPPPRTRAWSKSLSASCRSLSPTRGQAASVAPQSHQQCQQCQSLQAEVGELRGMVANYEATWKDAVNQLANMQQRLASAEDRADWLQAAMRSGSLPPPFVQADAHV